MALVLTGPLPKIGHWAAQTSAKSEMAHGSGSKFNNPVTPRIGCPMKNDNPYLNFDPSSHHWWYQLPCPCHRELSVQICQRVCALMMQSTSPFGSSPRILRLRKSVVHIQGTALFNFQMFPDFWGEAPKKKHCSWQWHIFCGPSCSSDIYIFALFCIYSHLHLTVLTNTFSVTTYLHNGLGKYLVLRIFVEYSSYMGMDQYLLIPFLGGWTSIYQLFWCSPGVQGFDPSPYDLSSLSTSLPWPGWTLRPFRVWAMMFWRGRHGRRNVWGAEKRRDGKWWKRWKNGEKWGKNMGNTLEMMEQYGTIGSKVYRIIQTCSPQRWTSRSGNRTWMNFSTLGQSK